MYDNNDFSNLKLWLANIIYENVELDDDGYIVDSLPLLEILHEHRIKIHKIRRVAKRFGIIVESELKYNEYGPDTNFKFNSLSKHIGG